MKAYLKCVIEVFHKNKSLADKAIAQVNDANFFNGLNEETNSIAVVVKHMAGNMHSRWTDFLTTDGEKPDRNRDSEFIIEARESREQLTAYWEAGWQRLFHALESLTVDDLNKTITIRNEPHSVIEAIERQLSHYSYHVGQIVLLARFFTGEKWQTLSVARGQSEEFNRKMKSKS